MVNDGDDIGEALARPGAGTKDVVLSGPREMDGFLLVQVQIQGQTDSAGIPLEEVIEFIQANWEEGTKEARRVAETIFETIVWPQS